MLEKWLAPVAMDRFMRANLGRAPYARPSAASAEVALLDWETLGRVLTASPAPDVLVASRGRLVNAPAPSTLAGVKALMARGFGIVVRKAELHDARLSALAAAFARDLPGQVHIQLYATPAGTETFGWHFDFEDVFIVQTAGSKDYFFRENTVARDVSPGPNPDFRAVLHETSALLSAKLLTGDWLYIPSRWWHLVRSVEDALSISIGVIPDVRSENRSEFG